MKGKGEDARGMALKSRFRAASSGSKVVVVVVVDAERRANTVDRYTLGIWYAFGLVLNHCGIKLTRLAKRALSFVPRLGCG